MLATFFIQRFVLAHVGGITVIQQMRAPSSTNQLVNAPGLAQHEDDTYFGPQSMVALVQKSGIDSGYLSARDTPMVLAPQDSWPPYPFLEGRRPEMLWEQVQEVLPSQSHILRFDSPHSIVQTDLNVHRYFGVYQSVEKFFPAIADSEDFEAEVLEFIKDQASGKLSQRFDSSLGRTAQVNLTHLGRLLAALASGVQYSNLEYQERTELKREYGQFIGA